MIRRSVALICFLVALNLFPGFCLPGYAADTAETVNKPQSDHQKSAPAKKQPGKRTGMDGLSKEDRAVVKNLDLLEMMTLLKDMDVLASTEEKK